MVNIIENTTTSQSNPWEAKMENSGELQPGSSANIGFGLEYATNCNYGFPCFGYTTFVCFKDVLYVSYLEQLCKIKGNRGNRDRLFSLIRRWRSLICNYFRRFTIIYTHLQQFFPICNYFLLFASVFSYLQLFASILL